MLLSSLFFSVQLVFAIPLVLKEHFSDHLIISCNRYFDLIIQPVPQGTSPFYLVFLKAIYPILLQYGDTHIPQTWLVVYYIPCQGLLHLYQ